MIGKIIGSLIFGVLAGAAVGTAVATIVVYVAEKINAKTLRDEAIKNGINKGIIEMADGCSNVVKLKDLNSNKELEIHGNGVDSNLKEGDVIYV